MVLAFSALPKQSRKLVAANALVEAFGERLQRCATGMGPKRQLQHIHSATAAFAAAYQVLAYTQQVSQLALAQPNLSAEGLELLQKQRVLLGM